MTAGTLAGSWSATAARSAATGLPAPYATPLAAQIANKGNGNWLLAVVSWRQDAGGAAGVVAEPGTVSIADDGHNMWLPAAVSAPNQGVMRCAAWMAPAARQAQWVFASPSAYQQALALQVLEFTAEVPWYLVAVTAQAYANQGTSVSAAFTPPAGVFCTGVISWDYLQSATVTPPSGWTLAGTVTASDGTDHLGDLSQSTYYGTGAGSPVTLSASAGSSMDWSALLVSVHGITDAIAMPWSWPNPGWPVVLTEMGLGYYSGATPDEILWTDISGRNSSLAPMTVSRQIQYEDQTLTAGQLTMAADNPDAALTPPSPVPASPPWQLQLAGTTGSNTTFRVPASQSQVGVFLNNTALGLGSWAAAQSMWQSWTGVTPGVTRVYMGTSPWTISSDMAAMISAGVKMLISLQPAYNPVSSGDLAYLQAFIAALQAAGAQADITFWDEPYYSGLTSAQYISAVQYYGPSVRPYYRLFFITSTGAVYYSNENSYYPGDAWVDGCGCDFYASSPFVGATLTQASLPANNANPPKPFSIWEFNASPASTGQAPRAVTAFYLQNVLQFMQARGQAGLPNGDLCLFNGAPGENALGSSASQQTAQLGNWVAAGNSVIAWNSSLTNPSGITGAIAITAQAAGNAQIASCAAANITTQGFPCSPGDVINVNSWFEAAATSRVTQAGAQFYTSAGASISSLYGSAEISDGTGAWTQSTQATVTAPATAAYYRVLLQTLSNAANEVHYTANYEARDVESVNATQTTTISFPWDPRAGLWLQVYEALNNTTGLLPVAAGDVFTAVAAGPAGACEGPFTITAVSPVSGGYQTVTFEPAAAAPLAAPQVLLQAWADADIPFRVRTVWPWSATPYSVLFSGYTDQLEPQYDPDLLRGWVQVTASDVWSRMTAELLTATQQEKLQDTPYGYWPLSDAAGSLAAHQISPGPAPALMAATSKYGAGAGITAAFGSDTLVLPGDPGGSGWSVSGITSADTMYGTSLVLFPANPLTLPAVGTGVTIEVWAGIAAEVTGITWNEVIAACFGPGQSGTLWELWAGAPAGANPGEIYFTVYDKVTHAATSALISATPAWSTSALFDIAFTQTAWSVTMNGSTTVSGTCNLPSSYSGLIWNGLNLPTGGPAGNGINAELYGIAMYPRVLPPDRVLSHYWIDWKAAAASPGAGDYDVARISRVAGYGGFLPVMGWRGLDLIAAGGGDTVTAITDTSGQISSAYLTNIATSALAAMFADGPGTLIYRRRAEWYDRTPGNWVLGELLSVPVNFNPQFTADLGTSSWTAVNASPGWSASAGLAGSSAAVLTASGAGVVTWTPEWQPARPGQEWQTVIAVRAPAGYAGGAEAVLTFANSSHATIGSPVISAAVPLTAGAWTFLTVTGTAPAGTAYLTGSLVTSGTPGSGTVVDVDSVLTTLVPGEVPYTGDVKFSLDRAQMYNEAVITQYGTADTEAQNTGTNITYTDTSGVTVYTQDPASVAARGKVPYTVTSYLLNTASAAPYVPSLGSLEDFGNWICYTLGAPQLRGEAITITPAATGGLAWEMALAADIGDTAVVRRRPGAGQPETQVTAYLSGVSHNVDFGSGGPRAWAVDYTPSPCPQASVLQCDSPVTGILSGANSLGW